MTDHLEKARELGETLVAQETATGTNSTTDSISLAILAHVALADLDVAAEPEEAVEQETVEAKPKKAPAKRKR